MVTQERLLGMMDWAAKNVNHNLDFVPDEKLDWKPAPDAKSVLDIAHEIALSTDSIANFLATGEYQKNVARPTTREEAKSAITAAAETYAKVLPRLTREQLAGTAHFPWGEVPMGEAIGMPVIEILHHHGQIAYIQTLLGDTDSHFFQLGS
ncbi:MAG: DinB family protein [Abditibacteriaceae bacterium]